MVRGGVLIVRTGKARLNDATAGKRPAIRKNLCGVVSVTETGVAIDNLAREVVEESFSAAKEILTGQSLRIAIAARILESNGGCVKVEDSPVHGVSITAYMPLADEPEGGGEDEPMIKLDVLSR